MSNTKGTENPKAQRPKTITGWLNCSGPGSQPVDDPLGRTVLCLSLPPPPSDDRPGDPPTKGT